MTIHAIVAVADNGIIGGDGGMLWHVPEDWARLKRLTMGGHLVMGRATFESIGKPLPGRTSIVLTRNPDWATTPQAEGAVVVHTVAQALAQAQRLDPEATVWIFGGGQVYRAAWDLIDRFEVTEVHQSPEGDASLPPITPEEFEEVAREDHDGYSFVTYQRRTA